MACAADLTLPSAITTLAYTNCGDRINHSFHKYYNAGMFKHNISKVKCTKVCKLLDLVLPRWMLKVN